jgi:hypothetical protein
MTALSTLARMLGVRRDLAEDVLHSERAAKAVLSRRCLFAAGAAMVAGDAFSFGFAEDEAAYREWVRQEFVRECTELWREQFRTMTMAEYWGMKLRKDWTPFLNKALESVPVCTVRFIDKA